MKNKIIIQRGVDYPGAGGMSFSGGLGIENFETLVLYWDGVVNLPSPFVQQQDTEEIIILREQGLYEDQVIDIIKSGDMGDIHADATRVKLKKMLNDKSINYGINGLAERVFNGDPESSVQGGTLIHLVNSLPYPKKGTPIDELLEFRHKREDSLKLLMIKINELELRVSKSENQSMELRNAIIEIDKQICDLIRQYKEKGLHIDFASFKLNFNMSDILNICLKTYGVASTVMSHGHALGLSAAAGFASTISWSDAIRINNVDKNNPMTYALDVKKQFNT